MKKCTPKIIVFKSKTSGFSLFSLFKILYTLICLKIGVLFLWYIYTEKYKNRHALTCSGFRSLQITPNHSKSINTLLISYYDLTKLYPRRFVSSYLVGKWFWDLFFFVSKFNSDLSGSCVWASQEYNKILHGHLFFICLFIIIRFNRSMLINNLLCKRHKMYRYINK